MGDKSAAAAAAAARATHKTLLIFSSRDGGGGIRVSIPSRVLKRKEGSASPKGGW